MCQRRCAGLFSFRNFIARLFVLSALITACAVFTKPAAADVRHLYDEDGRLAATLGPNGESVQYEYDAAGNLISTTRTNGSGVSISSFAPTFGNTGITVTITGTGFSTTPAQNAVEFNGVAATVNTATATQLTVTVPATATTGPISVVTPTGTTVASSIFTVGLPVPTITSFTPLGGTSGTSVTITGVGFDTAVGGTAVKFNQVTASITAITGTSITATVPSGSASGKIKVTTSRGTATSATDFIIPPAGISTADVIARQRVVTGTGASPLAISTSNKYGALLFDGNQGELVTVNVSSYATTPVNSTISYWVYGPTNTLVTSGNVVSTVRSIHLPVLATTGTYTVYFRPISATANISVSTSLANLFFIDGVALTNTTTFPGQSIRFGFSASSGQRVGLGVTGMSLTPLGSSANVSVYKPDNSLLANIGCIASTGCSINFGPTNSGPAFYNFASSGIYKIVVTPNSGAVGTFTTTLSSEAMGTVSIGSTHSLSIPRLGQNARLSINGTAGQQLGLAMANASLSPTAAGPLYYYIYKPDNTLLVNYLVSHNDTTVLDIPALPTTGTYTLYVEPATAAISTANVVLSQDVAGTLTVNGTPTNSTIALKGQTARLTFSATAGERLGFGLNNFSLSPGGSLTANIYKPDGGLVTSCSGPVNCSINLGPTTSGPTFINLPTTGTYSAVIVPSINTTGSFTATLSSEVTTTLVPSTPYSLSIARAGQNGRLTFSGTAGQPASVSFTSVSTTPASQVISYYIYRQDTGSVVTSGASSGSSFTLNVASLPVTGTYFVYVEPSAWALNATVTLGP